MVDFRSGQKWTDLSRKLVQSFENDFSDDIIKTRQELQKFQKLTAALSGLLGMKVFWSGSIVEGSMMDPTARGFETDVMISPTNLILSRDQQREMFEYISEVHGYVRLRVTEDLALHLRDAVPKLNVRRNVDSGAVFVVSDFASGESDVISELPDNFFTRALSDTLHFDSLFTCVSPQGPACNQVVEGIAHIFEGITSPKQLLQKFAINAGNRYISKLTKQEKYGDKLMPKGENPTKQKAFDYISLSRTQPNSISLDFVFSLECTGWPEIASEYFNRDRNWPPPATLNKIRNDGFHLVYKPLDKDCADSVEWRISFSKAEAALFNSMSPPMMHCYRIFKTIYYCELTLPKVLCSYYMKTIFLWVCERLPEDVWDESNLAQVVLGLLDELVHCLVTKSCPHYFIPECNLLEHAHQDFLLDLARKVLEIRTHPDRYPKSPTKPDGEKSHQASWSNVEGDIELD
ncbi:predicted protein [Nematostella vectensis]|uniref:Uncharacterized protein n=1 Tax=Nematostella vectensis TaxID=45351 RepID=A7S6E3_NEMVE|nr:predicted protein [Nematostella vectensis]|eukprot:XP_001632796.1 predicted protein [Nematostella vectensis]